MLIPFYMSGLTFFLFACFYILFKLVSLHERQQIFWWFNCYQVSMQNMSGYMQNLFSMVSGAKRRRWETRERLLKRNKGGSSLFGVNDNVVLDNSSRLVGDDAVSFVIGVVVIVICFLVLIIYLLLFFYFLQISAVFCKEHFSYYCMTCLLV